MRGIMQGVGPDNTPVAVRVTAAGEVEVSDDADLDDIFRELRAVHRELRRITLLLARQQGIPESNFPAGVELEGVSIG